MDKLVVNPSATQAGIVAFLRYLIMITASVSAILGLLSKHDLTGLVAYFQSESGLAFIAAIAGVATAVYGIWQTYTKHRFLVIAGRNPEVPEVTVSGGSPPVESKETTT